MANATRTKASHPKMAVLRWAALQRPMRAARLRECLSGVIAVSLVRVPGARGGPPAADRASPRPAPGRQPGDPWTGGRFSGGPRGRCPARPRTHRSPAAGGAPVAGAHGRAGYVGRAPAAVGDGRRRSARCPPPPARRRRGACRRRATAPRWSPRPRGSSARTPAEPSAFITTADQSPFWTGQTTVWVPAPAADFSQKPREAGGAGTPAPPARSRRPAPPSKSATCVRTRRRGRR